MPDVSPWPAKPRPDPVAPSPATSFQVSSTHAPRALALRWPGAPAPVPPTGFLYYKRCLTTPGARPANRVAIVALLWLLFRSAPGSEGPACNATARQLHLLSRHAQPRSLLRASALVQSTESTYQPYP